MLVGNKTTPAIFYKAVIANSCVIAVVFCNKQSDYNTITKNISSENRSNGYALLNNSNLNILKNNISINNRDNFVVSSSCLDTLLNNSSYNPRGSHLRISNASIQNYAIGNVLYGGQLGGTFMVTPHMGKPGFSFFRVEKLTSKYLAAHSRFWPF